MRLRLCVRLQFQVEEGEKKLMKIMAIFQSAPGAYNQPSNNWCLDRVQEAAHMNNGQSSRI